MITRDEFIAGFDAPSTQMNAKSVFKRFDQYLATKKSDEKEFFDKMNMVEQSDRARKIREIQNFWLDSGNSVNTIKVYRSFLLEWLEENDITISPLKLKKLAKIPKRLNEMPYTPDTKTVLKIIHKLSLEDATFCIIQATSAMRQGEVHDLRVCDIDFDHTPTMIRIKAENTKTRTERLTFLTPEASKMLKKLIKNKNISDQDRIFTKHMTVYHANLRVVLRKLGLDDKFVTGRMKMSLHRFRAAANQAITEAVDPRYADVIKGHISGLRTYDAGDLKKMSRDYKKAVPLLTLDKTQQLEELQEKEGNKDATQDIMIREIENLKLEMERIKDSQVKQD